jgi:hypothetical protein
MWGVCLPALLQGPLVVLPVNPSLLIQHMLRVYIGKEVQAMKEQHVLLPTQHRLYVEILQKSRDLVIQPTDIVEHVHRHA